MSHFGLICPATAGHLNPHLPLGQVLQHRGHQVTVFGVLDAESKARAAGLGFWAIAPNRYPIGSVAARAAQLGQLTGLAALRYSVRWGVKSISLFLQEAPAIFKQAQVDSLIIDQVYYAGRTVAEYLNLPFINFCASLPLNQEADIPPCNTNWNYQPSRWNRLRNQIAYGLLNRMANPIRQVIADYRQQWKLPPYTSLSPNQFFSQLAQISQLPAEFEFPRKHLPDCFHFTGPFHATSQREPIPFPWERLTGQPLIYASLGTLQNRVLHLFQIIAAACADFDAQLVMSLGGNNPESLPELPGTPLVVQYAPQLELLQQAALTITHAGPNTILESLTYGKPLVAIPIANDQPGAAARLARTGAGERVPLANLTVPRLRQAIAQVLENDSYKQQALRLQAAIQRSGGVYRAADIVEQAISAC
jgi:MGT family glycosyltransferase